MAKEIEPSLLTVQPEEHVLVYDGYLLSDLDGEPTVPTSSSSVPIPANFNFAFNIYGETDEACSAVYASSDTTSTPYACFAFEEVPGGDPFYAFKNTINDGWQCKHCNTNPATSLWICC